MENIKKFNVMFLLNILSNWLDRKKIKLDPNKNYCLDCGACCSHYVVNFPKKESQSNNGWVPVKFTEKFDSKTINMIGRKKYAGSPCICLSGEVGKKVSCDIYESRPSVCRDFNIMSASGVQNSKCKKARKAKGLTPDLV